MLRRTRTNWAHSVLLVIVAFLSLVATNQAFGQSGEGEGEEEEHIETDRDSFTRSPRIVRPNDIVIEGSYTFLDQPDAPEGHLYPDFLARYGALDWLELRLGWTYEVGKYAHLAHEEEPELEEEGIIIYAAKAYLTKACGWRPDSSLIVAGYTPTSGESNDSDVSLEYAFGWRGENGLELDGGFRWFHAKEGEDRFHEWAPSVVLKRNLLCEHINVHVEYFGLFTTEREEDYTQHYAGPGIHYLITPDLEIGARVFWGLGGDAANFISNVGIGVRF